MAQTNAPFASMATACNWKSAQQYGRSLFSLVVILILLPCAALAQRLGALTIPAAGIESQRSPLTSFADKAAFTLAPDAPPRDSGLLINNGTSLLLQTANPPIAGNLAGSVPPWGTPQKVT